ncbi:hypothetical protein HK103_001775 [Boothiomyces macroporosus]|uniref:Uncharacterized protein n=1 Tax=Boothiomyces macroporosus TaxID=261099 RepID=A0AAD5UAH6_9FUNG|nr:hypothetical protein HK103_001775 [Boothiomyces macroporosus]
MEKFESQLKDIYRLRNEIIKHKLEKEIVELKTDKDTTGSIRQNGDASETRQSGDASETRQSGDTANKENHNTSHKETRSDNSHKGKHDPTIKEATEESNQEIKESHGKVKTLNIQDINKDIIQILRQVIPPLKSRFKPKKTNSSKIDCLLLLINGINYCNIYQKEMEKLVLYTNELVLDELQTKIIIDGFIKTRKYLDLFCLKIKQQKHYSENFMNLMLQKLSIILQDTVEESDFIYSDLSFNELPEIPDCSIDYLPSNPSIVDSHYNPSMADSSSQYNKNTTAIKSSKSELGRIELMHILKQLLLLFGHDYKMPRESILAKDHLLIIKIVELGFSFKTVCIDILKEIRNYYSSLIKRSLNSTVIHSKLENIDALMDIIRGKYKPIGSEYIIPLIGLLSIHREYWKLLKQLIIKNYDTKLQNYLIQNITPFSITILGMFMDNYQIQLLMVSLLDKELDIQIQAAKQLAMYSLYFKGSTTREISLYLYHFSNYIQDIKSENEMVGYSLFIHYIITHSTKKTYLCSYLSLYYEKILLNSTELQEKAVLYCISGLPFDKKIISILRKKTINTRITLLLYLKQLLKRDYYLNRQIYRIIFGNELDLKNKFFMPLDEYDLDNRIVKICQDILEYGLKYHYICLDYKIKDSDLLTRTKSKSLMGDQGKKIHQSKRNFVSQEHSNSLGNVDSVYLDHLNSVSQENIEYSSKRKRVDKDGRVNQDSFNSVSLDQGTRANQESVKSDSQSRPNSSSSYSPKYKNTKVETRPSDLDTEGDSYPEGQAEEVVKQPKGSSIKNQVNEPLTLPKRPSSPIKSPNSWKSLARESQEMQIEQEKSLFEIHLDNEILKEKVQTQVEKDFNNQLDDLFNLEFQKITLGEQNTSEQLIEKIKADQENSKARKKESKFRKNKEKIMGEQNNSLDSPILQTPMEEHFKDTVPKTQAMPIEHKSKIEHIEKVYLESLNQSLQKINLPIIKTPVSSPVRIKKEILDFEMEKSDETPIGFSTADINNNGEPEIVTAISLPNSDYTNTLSKTFIPFDQNEQSTAENGKNPEPLIEKDYQPESNASTGVIKVPQPRSPTEGLTVTKETEISEQEPKIINLNSIEDFYSTPKRKNEQIFVTPQRGSVISQTIQEELSDALELDELQSSPVKPLGMNLDAVWRKLGASSPILEHSINDTFESFTSPNRESSQNIGNPNRFESRRESIKPATIVKVPSNTEFQVDIKQNIPKAASQEEVELNLGKSFNPMAIKEAIDELMEKKKQDEKESAPISTPTTPLQSLKIVTDESSTKEQKVEKLAEPEKVVKRPKASILSKSMNTLSKRNEHKSEMLSFRDESIYDISKSLAPGESMIIQTVAPVSIPIMKKALMKAVELSVRHLKFAREIEKVNYYSVYADGLNDGILSRAKITVPIPSIVVETLHPALKEAFLLDTSLFGEVLTELCLDYRPNTKDPDERLFSWIQGLVSVHKHLLPLSMSFRQLEKQLKKPIALGQALVLIRDKISVIKLTSQSKLTETDMIRVQSTFDLNNTFGSMNRVYNSIAPFEDSLKNWMKVLVTPV